MFFYKTNAGVLETLGKNDYSPFGMNYLNPIAGSFFGKEAIKLQVQREGAAGDRDV